MQFGIFDILQVDPERQTRAILSERLGQHQYADELGLDFIFVAERHFMPFYRAATPNLLLATLAATTSNARLGTMAYTLALHNPALLAEEISTLDHLSDGRLEVGVGLGHRPEEISAIGLPAEHRYAIFLECLTMMLEMWTGRPVTRDGGLYHMRDILVDPPLQRPHPPLWYAGNDPKIAGWARQFGLSLALGFQPDEALRGPAEAFRAVEPSVEMPSRLALMRHVYVAETAERARAEIIDDLMRLGAELASNPRGITNAPQHPPTRADAERQYLDQRERQIVVSGDAEEVAQVLAASARTLGLDVFLANAHLMGVEDARIRRTLRLYAEQVAPRVRELLAG
jgi:alkanesulfonate monooxygenase SsuD/methylene tetrahydromethanopterin reductase-like flavin-dependent oxidoreductase (luciferase family)